MNLNATLFGEILTFIALVWFTLKFIWPPLLKAMNERQQKIADGLAAAERGQLDLGLAREKISESFRQTKQQTEAMLAKAREQGVAIVEDERARAKLESERILDMSQKELELRLARSQEQREKASIDLAVLIAEKILKNKIDMDAQNKILEDLLRS